MPAHDASSSTNPSSAAADVHPREPASAPEGSSGQDAEEHGTSGPRSVGQRSLMDRVARQVLLIEDASPRAMFELRGSLLFTGIRCTITYALIPLLAPVIGWAGVLATPVSLVLSSAAVVLAVNSLRRVWLADYHHRWAYTAFIVTAVALLAVVIVGDVRTLLG